MRNRDWVANISEYSYGEDSRLSDHPQNMLAFTGPEVTRWRMSLWKSFSLPWGKEETSEFFQGSQPQSKDGR